MWYKNEEHRVPADDGLAYWISSAASSHHYFLQCFHPQISLLAGWCHLSNNTFHPAEHELNCKSFTNRPTSTGKVTLSTVTKLLRGPLLSESNKWNQTTMSGYDLWKRSFETLAENQQQLKWCYLFWQDIPDIGSATTTSWLLNLNC